MRKSLKWPLSTVLASSLVASGLGCSSGEVDRMDVPGVAPPPAPPMEEQSEADQPTEGSSAGMNFNPTRGATFD